MKILILQHPSESKEPWNTSALLQDPELFIAKGLSWPNLNVAWNKAGGPSANLQIQKWAVFFLGTQAQKQDLVVWKPELCSTMQGLIFIDGTWSQSKTLWWRNPWLTKAQRFQLPFAPQQTIYSKVRKEPRKNCRSTFEAVQSALGVDPTLTQATLSTWIEQKI